MVVAVHGPGCGFCAEMAEQARRRAAGWRTWGVELVVLRESPRPLQLPVPQLLDPAGRTREQFGAQVDAALLVVDRRGVVVGWWPVVHPEEPEWSQVDATARWVGVQEPECGTCGAEESWERLC